MPFSPGIPISFPSNISLIPPAFPIFREKPFFAESFADSPLFRSSSFVSVLSIVTRIHVLSEARISRLCSFAVFSPCGFAATSVFAFQYFLFLAPGCLAVARPVLALFFQAEAFLVLQAQKQIRINTVNKTAAATAESVIAVAEYLLSGFSSLTVSSAGVMGSGCFSITGGDIFLYKPL